MGYNNNEVYNVIIRINLFLFGSVFWLARWAVAHISSIGERLAKIEGREEGRKEKESQDGNTGGNNL